MLAPDSMATLSDHELHLNLKAVTETGIELPTETYASLVGIAAASLLSSTDFDDAKLKKLIVCVKPWPGRQSMDIDVADRSTWLLSNVRGLPETEACSWFVNTFMVGFLGSQIDKGESSAALVAKVCKIAIKEWEDDSTVAVIGESTVDTMDSILKCFNVLCMLIEYRVTDMSDDTFKEIEWFGNLRTSSAEGVQSVMAVNMAQNVWYNDRLNKLLDNKMAVDTYGEDFVKDLEWWTNAVHKWQPAVTKDMAAATKRLCLYEVNLLEDMVRPIKDISLKKVKLYIMDGVQSLSSNPSQDGMHGLVQLASDCTLAFSLDSEIDEMSAQVNKLSRSHAVSALQVDFFNGMGELARHEDLATIDACPAVMKLEEFFHNNQAFAVPHNNAAFAVLRTDLGKCFPALEYLYNKEVVNKSSTIVRLLATKVATCLPSGDDVRLVAMLWSLLFELRFAVHSFTSLGSTPAERLAKDQGDNMQWPLLSLMRVAVDKLVKASLPAAEDLQDVVKKIGAVARESQR